MEGGRKGAKKRIDEERNKRKLKDCTLSPEEEIKKENKENKKSSGHVEAEQLVGKRQKVEKTERGRMNYYGTETQMMILRQMALVTARSVMRERKGVVSS